MNRSTSSPSPALPALGAAAAVRAAWKTSSRGLPEAQPCAGLFWRLLGAGLLCLLLRAVPAGRGGQTVRPLLSRDGLAPRTLSPVEAPRRQLPGRVSSLRPLSGSSYKVETAGGPCPLAVLGRQGGVGAEARLGCDGGVAFQVFPGAYCPLRSWRAPLQDRGAGHTHTSSLNPRRAPQVQGSEPRASRLWRWGTSVAGRWTAACTSRLPKSKASLMPAMGQVCVFGRGRGRLGTGRAGPAL